MPSLYCELRKSLPSQHVSCIFDQHKQKEAHMSSTCCLVQEAIRSKMGGNVTAFSTVVDGQHTLHSGDALRLATKPVVVARALYFVVGQVGAASPYSAHVLHNT